MWPVRAGLVCFCICSLVSGVSRADRPEKKYSAWQSDEHTLFVASASDVGVVYFRPHLTAGWGAPFWQFVGVDAYAISTNSFAAGYVGWRASLPWLDVQLGYRRTHAYNRQFLVPRALYTDTDLDLPDGGERSSYEVIELEITPAVPLFHGAAFVEIHPMWIQAPRDRYVYEEVLRAVTDSYFAMRTRLGYVYSFGESGSVKLGGMIEYLVLPQRPSNVTRVGPVILISVSKNVEVLGTITMVLSSPDELGIYQGSYGLLGMRLRLAERF